MFVVELAPTRSSINDNLNEDVTSEDQYLMDADGRGGRRDSQVKSMCCLKKDWIWIMEDPIREKS